MIDVVEYQNKYHLLRTHRTIWQWLKGDYSITLTPIEKVYERTWMGKDWYEEQIKCGNIKFICEI